MIIGNEGNRFEQSLSDMLRNIRFGHYADREPLSSLEDLEESIKQAAPTKYERDPATNQMIPFVRAEKPSPFALILVRLDQVGDNYLLRDVVDIRTYFTPEYRARLEELEREAEQRRFAAAEQRRIDAERDEKRAILQARLEEKLRFDAAAKLNDLSDPNMSDDLLDSIEMSELRGVNVCE